MFTRIALTTLLLASILGATPVYLTAKGKIYHTDRKCSSLAHITTAVLVADDKDAINHGLRICTVCKKRSAAKKTDNTSFAKPEGKK